MRRWPLFVIAAPAAVAVWSGWVGLGGLCTIVAADFSSHLPRLRSGGGWHEPRRQARSPGKSPG
jgi:hypothetical protein